MGKRGAKRARYSAGAVKLLIVAERLIGEYGVDAVSLRRIITTAGHANKSAVQHHFGTKDRLVRAIIEERTRALEIARHERLQRIGDLEAASAADLLRALLLPILDIVDERGELAYANFVAQLWQNHRQKFAFLEEPGAAPARNRLFAALHAKTPHLNRERFAFRTLVVQTMFLVTITDRARARVRERVEDVIVAGAAALCAPAPAKGKTQV